MIYHQFIVLLPIICILIGAAISWALSSKYNHRTIYLSPILVGGIVGIVILVSLSASETQKNAQELQSWLVGLKELDCSLMGDVILKNHLGGNVTKTRAGILLFTENGCQFDISTRAVLEGLK